MSMDASYKRFSRKLRGLSQSPLAAVSKPLRLHPNDLACGELLFYFLAKEPRKAAIYFR